MVFVNVSMSLPIFVGEGIKQMTLFGDRWEVPDQFWGGPGQIKDTSTMMSEDISDILVDICLIDP